MASGSPKEHQYRRAELTGTPLTGSCRTWSHNSGKVGWEPGNCDKDLDIGLMGIFDYFDKSCRGVLWANATVIVYLIPNRSKIPIAFFSISLSYLLPSITTTSVMDLPHIYKIWLYMRTYLNFYFSQLSGKTIANKKNREETEKPLKEKQNTWNRQEILRK